MTDPQGILDQMVRDSMSDKSNAAKKLTPVGTERMPALAGVFPAMFPNDEPAEVIVAAVREVRRQLAIIDEALFEAERVAVGEEKARENAGMAWRVTGREGEEKSRAAVKAEEKAADERAVKHPAEYKEGRPVNWSEGSQMEADERAAVIRERLEGTEQKEAAFGVAEPPPGDGWECPTHGMSALTTRKNLRREVFRACTECKEFEKL